jgi:hypothetical protein
MAFDLNSFMQTQLRQTGSAPSRRSNKNHSGRTGRKAHNGRKALQKVGGSSNLIKAIYAPADKNLCVVVPMETGWLPNGQPNRL